MAERTIYEACEDATDHIWDDREQYILATLKTLHIDPSADYDQYLRDIHGFGARLLPAVVGD